MQKLHFAYPGDLDTPTGGYGYDRRVISGLEGLGWQVDCVSLGEGFPFPTDVTLAAAKARLAELPAGATVVVDGLAFGVMAQAAADLADHLSLVALVHHPLCQENGMEPAQVRALQESENASLRHARHVIVTSPATARQVEDLFGVASDKITVVIPGTDHPDSVVRTPSNTIRLLSVGTLVPRKGHDLLLDALSQVSSRNWCLDLVGGLEANPACYQDLKKRASNLGLIERVNFRGAVQSGDLTEFYQRADLFVLASRYEGYGMAFTEALAHGLPVIGSGGGAVRNTLPETASIYCETENTTELREALNLLISDTDKRAALADAALQTARNFPSWQDASNQFAQVLQKVAA
ncbi:Mannosylfructose-phosphate synthase [Roseibium album]|nr:Mannosylfructose-phosphate synthase [Roseibium album]